MAVEFQENRAGIAAMLASDMVARAVGDICNRGMTAAVANTPVDTGRMKASWHTSVDTGTNGVRGRIYNTARSNRGAPYPLFLELGTKYIRPTHILGRALDEMGKTK